MRREKPSVRLPEISPLRLPLRNHPRIAVVARFLTLDSASLLSETLLGVMEGGRAEEARIHRRFGHLKIARYGELFRAAPDLMGFIDRIEGMPIEPAADRAAVTVEWVCFLAREAHPDYLKMYLSDPGRRAYALRVLREYVNRAG